MRDESQKEILLTESSSPENQGHDDDTHTITYYPTAVDLVQGQEGSAQHYVQSATPWHGLTNRASDTSCSINIAARSEIIYQCVGFDAQYAAGPPG